MEQDLIRCPYNKAHAIIRHRMPKHLIKCVKHYQGDPLATCPFNAMHKFPERDLKEHLETCPDYIANIANMKTETKQETRNTFISRS